MKIEFTLNEKIVSIDTDPSRRLLDVLRNDFSLTGAKEGCGEGECGACSVLLDNHVVNSCLIPLGNVHGKTITTIENYKQKVRFEILEEAFMHEGSVQCGICIPGMIIAAESLLHHNPNPTENEIRIGISGNLCRCTGYNMIVKAIQRAAIRGKGLW